MRTSRAIKYTLFAFCYIFWSQALAQQENGAQVQSNSARRLPEVNIQHGSLELLFWNSKVASGLMIAVGIYSKTAVEGGAVDSLIADPALILITVGCLIFCITFLGCFGALRDIQILLKIFLWTLLLILLLQVTVATLGFIFSEKVEKKAVGLLEKGIIRYRDDLDLQNLIDYIQKKVLNTMCGYETQQLKFWTARKKIYTAGCLDTIVQWGHKNLLLIGGIALGVLLLEILLISLTAILLKQIHSIKKKINRRSNMH
ncbi:tetraspanin-33 isoform X3 [Mobula birostris]|uniref:tetraspanin-33 isoform X3 n=1 Tax=Mobula birostris TaxID=1983395 RepID=UPI003B288392